MAAVTLEDIKSIDQKIKDVIHGYIRNVQKEMPQDNIYFTIPALVIHWIMIFYYIAEHFD